MSFGDFLEEFVDRSFRSFERLFEQPSTDELSQSSCSNEQDQDCDDEYYELEQQARQLRAQQDEIRRMEREAHDAQNDMVIDAFLHGVADRIRGKGNL